MTVSLVTGAGSGIGAAVAAVLAERGDRVACVDVDGAAAEASAPPPPRMVIRIPGSALAVARRVTLLAEAGITDLVVDVDWTDPADPRRTVEIIRGAMP